MNTVWVWVTDLAGDDYLLNINTGATFRIVKAGALFEIRHGGHVIFSYDSDGAAASAMTNLGTRLCATSASDLVDD